MNSVNTLELFCGRAEISRAFENYLGVHHSVDTRKRRGTCEPTHHMSVLEVLESTQLLPSYDVIWASPPCTAWSYASGNNYYDNGHFKPSAEKYINLLRATCQVIDQKCPGVWFIEAPVGHIMRLQWFREWCVQKSGIAYKISLRRFGHPMLKPTYIFSNLPGLFDGGSFMVGRGYKSPGVQVDNLTQAQRQSMPALLATHVSKCAWSFLSSSFTPYSLF